MIYADNAATTRISDTVFEKMVPFFKDQYGNASSHYTLGTAAKRAIEKSRNQFATALTATPDEIFFTSCGSESNNWVLFGAALSRCKSGDHIITSSIEHHSVLNSCKALENQGIKITYLPVDHYGRVSLSDVCNSVQKNTKLVSIILANNEIGTIQPIAEIGEFLRTKNILFHTDAVQAVGNIPIDVKKLGVHFLTASAHKFNGPKGIGILYKRNDIELVPLIHGGSQEFKLRAGTENVAGIVGAGFAIEESVNNLQENIDKLNKLYDSTVKSVRKSIPDLILNGDPQHRLPNILSLTFDGVSGEALMHILDLKGIYVSTGSACSSGNSEPSHVLMAIGLSEQQAKGTIRISYNKYNDMDEVTKITDCVCSAYKKIKLMK